MTLITRKSKGSRLNIQEMDGNLEYLDSNNILDVEYLYGSNDLLIKRPNTSENIIQTYSYNLDRKIDINTSSVYTDSFYKEFEEPTNKFTLTYNDSLPILYDGNFNLSANFGYWINNIYNNVSLNSHLLSNEGYAPEKIIIGTGFSAQTNQIAIQSDGKILVGGAFTSYNGVTSNRIIRLNTDGSKDTSFVIGTGFGSNVNSISIQSDGKILVGGQFTTYKGVTSNRIIRLNTDGSKDTSFVIGTGFNGIVSSIAIQDDGKILVGGLFTSYNDGVTSNRIIRLNTDGSQDTSFVIGTGFPFTGGNVVNSIAIQDDGKILVGGLFTTYNGVTSNRIIRLNTDGSQDTSFVIGTGFSGSVNSISIQSDGKILVGGTFTSYNTITSNNIIRLNTDGSQDTSFVIGTGFSGSVNTISIQSDGKIIVAGNITSYNGVTSDRIIRLNTDGSQDTSFVIGTGFSSTVNSIVVQSDGKILVGGFFNSYNGVSSNYIIRLNSDGSSNNGPLEFNKSISYNFKTDNSVFELITENNELKILCSQNIQRVVISYRLLMYNNIT